MFEDGLTVITATLGRPSLRQTVESALACLPVAKILVAPADGVELSDVSDIAEVEVLPVTSGVYEAWNLGIDRAPTEHLMFVNDDDRLVGPPLQPETDAGQSLININFERADGGSRRSVTQSTFSAHLRPLDLFHSNRAGNINAYIWEGTLFNRFGRFDTSFQVGGDIEWMQRLIGSTLGISWANSPTYVQGRDAGRLSGWDAGSDRLVEEAARVVDRIEERHGRWSSPALLGLAWRKSLELRRLVRRRHGQRRT